MSEAGGLSKHLDQVTEEIMLALITDGGHHKQYHLERALRALCSDEWVEKAKAKFQWQEGIPS